MRFYFLIWALLALPFTLQAESLEFEGKMYPEVVFESVVNESALDTPSHDVDISQLEFQTRINQSKGYMTAYYRDLVKLNLLKQEKFMASISLVAVKMRKTFKSENHFLVFLEDSYLQKNDYQISQSDIDKIDEILKTNHSELSQQLAINYQKYKAFDMNSELALSYLLDRVDELPKQSLALQWMDINYWIEKINENDLSQEANSFLTYYLNTDLARIMIALAAFILILAVQHSVLIFIVWLLNRKERTSNQFWVKSLDFPFKLAAFLLASHISLYILISGGADLSGWLKAVNTGYIIALALAAYNLSAEWLVLYSDSFFDKYPQVRQELVSLVIKAVRLVFALVVLMFALFQLDVDIKAIVASLGVGGIAVAWALKETLSNVFAYMNIMVDESFKQGEWIQSEDKRINGDVVQIRVRTTTIRTFDNKLAFIPNIELANTPIYNLSRRVIGRRIKFHVRLALDTPSYKVEEYVRAVKDMLVSNEDIATENITFNSKSTKLMATEDALGVKRNILVYADSISSDAIEILVYCFSQTIDWEEWLNVKQSVILNCLDIAEQQDVEVAIPTSKVSLTRDNTSPARG